MVFEQANREIYLDVSKIKLTLVHFRALPLTLALVLVPQLDFKSVPNIIVSLPKHAQVSESER